MATKELANILVNTGYANNQKEAKAIVQFIKDNTIKKQTKPLVVVNAELCTDSERDKIRTTLVEYLGDDYYVIVSSLDNIKVYGNDFEKAKKGIEIIDNFIKDNTNESI